MAEVQNGSQFSEVPGIVSVKDFFYANGTVCIVMEYIDGGGMFENDINTAKDWPGVNVEMTLNLTSQE